MKRYDILLLFIFLLAITTSFAQKTTTDSKSWSVERKTLNSFIENQGQFQQRNLSQSPAEIKFAWQFRDKGTTFEISNQSEGDDALQCSQLSGIYTVENESKTEYEISSSATIGYNGKKVIIKMKKE